jgi:hypothetical protein
MGHFPRPNRVAYGILGRRHPGVFTLLEQNDRLLPVRSRTPCAASHLLRVRLTERALSLNDCASDTPCRLR